MSARSFFDTNILGYTDDRASPEKHSTALKLLVKARRQGTGVLSTQVLQEYFAIATRKMGVPVAVAQKKVEIFSHFDLILVDLPIILSAIDLHRAHQTSIWDSLIIRAAQRAKCSVLYTEDLHAGWEIEGLKIVNPFT